MNDDFALEVLKSAITALEGIFERGGFHRDIKPDNILLVQNNGKLSFKLSDFGLAHDNNATSVLTFGVRGTPTYFAPEVMRTGLFSQKADIYTLGITIIELLTKELIASNVNNLRNPFLKFYLPKMTQRNPENRCTLEELKRRLFKPLFKKTLSTFN